MYNRFDKGMHPKQCVLDQLLSCMSQKVTLEDNASELENVRHTRFQIPWWVWKVELGLNWDTEELLQPAG